MIDAASLVLGVRVYTRNAARLLLSRARPTTAFGGVVG